MIETRDPFRRPGRRPGHPVRVAVLGAGPVGLDAALAARAAGHDLRIYEATPHPSGHLRMWGHVRLFTPWRMNLSERMRQGLREEGIEFRVDAEHSPTGHELADLALDPLWRSSILEGDLRTGTRVLAVGRQGTLKHEEIGTGHRQNRPFRILIREGDGEYTEFADIVLDCTGTFGQPNTLGDGGIPAPGESSLGDRIRRRIPDFEKEGAGWVNGTILLAGAGHSAQTAARELDDLARTTPGTRVVWALRAREPDFGAVPDDPLPLRRDLVDAAFGLASTGSPQVEVRTGAVVDKLEPSGGRIRVTLRSDPSPEADASGSDDVEELLVDRILSLTGSVGDDRLYRQLQVHECYATSGPMKLAAALLGSAGGDCLDQTTHGAETLMNPEPGFFVLGVKSYGRNNTFLMQVGWGQVDEVFDLVSGASTP